jgi:hypothetical protein
VAGPDDALELIARTIRENDTMLSAHLREPAERPALGLLVAAGERARGAEADYAFVIEAIREGYLLHYGTPRVLAGMDPDLALLAGDHLYALGLECLAGLGDLEAVRELADLISLSALVHADGSPHGRTADALWLASTAAIAVGANERHEGAKAMLRERGPSEEVAAGLADAGRGMAAAGALETALEEAADSIDLA